jgi:colanic acid/amylovoran biosynthesis glycosyltransferase
MVVRSGLTSAPKRVLHFSNTLLARTETFVQSRLFHARFEAVAATWQHIPDGLSIPCPFIVLDRHEPRGRNDGLARMFKGPIRVAARNWSILRLLLGAKPDVVHAHFGTIGAGVAPFCQALGIPLVVSFYGFDLALDPADLKLHRAYAKMFRHGAVFTAEGPVLARRLVEIGAPAKHVRLLPLSLPAWAMEPPPPRAPRPAGRLRLFQVARFVEKKGVDLSLAAVARARARGVDVQLILAGGGPLEAELRALTAELRIQDLVRFIGYVRHDDLSSLLAGCDALIQPSRTSSTGDTEGGHPTIILEALAQGVPIVATRHADIPFVVRDGETGLLSEENDLASLVHNLVRLAVGPDLLESLARRARSAVLRRHSPDVLLLVKERVYREAIRAARARLVHRRWRDLPFSDPFADMPTAL